MDFKKGVSLLLLMRSGCVVFGASLCLLGDFDSQVKYLLNNEMLSSEEVRKMTLDCDELRETIRARWDDADLFVYGSLPAGLGSKTSDVDVYLRICSHNKSFAYIFEETVKVLRRQPKKFGHIVPKPEKAIPRITFYDNSMQRYVDLSFGVGTALANSKLLAYYLSLDNRHLSLAAIIKFWCKVHQLTGKGLLSNFSVYLMITFYLQQKNMAPSCSAIQAHLPPRYADNKWNINFEEMPFNIANNETLYELLGGFFKFYSDFNFSEKCVSPFLGRPLLKSNFRDISKVPEEFSLYVKNINKGYYYPLPMESELCVQDIFEHSRNAAQRVKKAGASKFIKHVTLAAKYYDSLPSDQFLRSILTRKNYRKTYTVGKHLEEHTILELKDCLSEQRSEEDYYYYSFKAS